MASPTAVVPTVQVLSELVAAVEERAKETSDRGLRVIRHEEFLVAHWHEDAAHHYAIDDPHHVTLIFFLDGARVGFEISPNGACSNSGTGRITILPPGAPGRWHCAGSMEYLAVCLPALHAIREENSPTTFLCLSDDPVLIRIGQVLAEILTRRGEMDPPEASAWSSLLGSHLVQRYGFARRWLTSKGQSRLSSAQIRSMVDFIDENLHEPLAVSQLAAMTGMSRAKFTESFKCSTGMSPYKFVIERRTLMAKKLLGHSNLSLSSIAHTVGFSSQSHMTSTFRRLAGITPQAYRAWQKPRRSEDVVKPRVGPSIGRGL